MGMRSQIYVYWDINCGNGKNYKNFIAKYYQFNYGISMISKASYIINQLKRMYDAGPLWFSVDSNFLLKELMVLFDVNFDEKVVCLNSDILSEAATFADSYGEKEIYENPNPFIFGQDNNDGQLLISVTNEGIKYAFIKYGGYYSTYQDKRPRTARGYLIMDRGVDWQSQLKEYAGKYYDENAVEYTKDNIKSINETATVMTKHEVTEFLNRDYREFIPFNKKEVK